MRRILTATIVGILCLSTFSILSPQVKALGMNTDFESGLGGWQPFTQYGGISQLSTTYAHSGTYSVEQSAHSSGSDPLSSIGVIKFPVASVLDQYELDLWVYVTERSDANAASVFGFAFGSEFVSWNPWGSSSSYVYVRQSEGYQTKGDWYNPVPYGLSLNTWHQVNVMVYTNIGTVSIWLDSSLIVDNWPSFNAGERPDYYYIEGSANYYGTYVMHQYIDDVYVSEELNQPPIADFTYLPTSPDIWQKVNFDASTSYDPDGGNIVSCEWDFGDGNLESGMIVNHKYKDEGTYAVTLTVTDDDGQTGTRSTSITVAMRIYYELFLEIDWMEGHAPSHESLAYIINYFKESDRMRISIHFNEEIRLDDWHRIDPDERTSETEFVSFEETYNNLGDDKIIGQNAIYTSKWKWILFGATSADRPFSLGLTHTDATYRWTAGNYIFIADDRISTDEVETLVLMHELGHSIGIWNWRFNDETQEWEEKYDAVPWSVMADADTYLSQQNPKYNTEIDETYSPHSWEMRNTEYYII